MKKIKDFAIGFFSCLVLFVFIGSLGSAPSGQLFNDYKDPTSLYIEFNNIYQNKQDRQRAVLPDTPTLSSIQEGESVIYSSGTIRHEITRIGDHLLAFPDMVQFQ